MPDEAPEEPQEPRYGRWRSRRAKARASAGLGFERPSVKRARAKERARQAEEAEEWLRGR
jgi:hypothetical protein